MMPLISGIGLPGRITTQEKADIVTSRGQADRAGGDITGSTRGFEGS